MRCCLFGLSGWVGGWVGGGTYLCVNVLAGYSVKELSPVHQLGGWVGGWVGGTDLCVDVLAGYSVEELSPVHQLSHEVVVALVF